MCERGDQRGEAQGMTTPLIEAIARKLVEAMAQAPVSEEQWQATSENVADRKTLDSWAEAALTAITEAGYAVVPVEPTEAMLERGRWEAESCTDDWTVRAACLPGHVYRGMISAAQGDG